jgi:hypothetical protein
MTSGRHYKHPYTNVKRFKEMVRALKEEKKS